VKNITKQGERCKRGGRDTTTMEKESKQCIEENTQRKRKRVPNSQVDGTMNIGVHWNRLKKRRI
jgi:hypothetical protein